MLMLFLPHSSSTPIIRKKHDQSQKELQLRSQDKTPSLGMDKAGKINFIKEPKAVL